LSELQLVFNEKTMAKKDANGDIRTYLLFGYQVQSFPAINRDASMLEQRGIETNKK